MVDRPLVFSLDELKRFPGRSIIRFLECSGNGGRAYRPDPKAAETTPQMLDGLTSTSEWTGVPLATLLREAGASPKATWFLAESQDAAVLARSIPMEKAMDDALIAYAQNGEALRPEQGYPVRLFLPGFEGSASVKWLRRIEVASAPFMMREETSKYTDPLPDGTARQFSFVMDAKSIITEPAFPEKLSGPGWREIRGIAWSGRGKIAHVDISVDGGATWQKATLDDPVLPKCHTRFRFAWNWTGGETTIMSRATDETGYSQPTLEALLDGARAGHAVPLQQHPRLEGGRRRHGDAGRGGRVMRRSVILGTIVISAAAWSAALVGAGAKPPSRRAVALRARPGRDARRDQEARHRRRAPTAPGCPRAAARSPKARPSTPPSARRATARAGKGRRSIASWPPTPATTSRSAAIRGWPGPSATTGRMPRRSTTTRRARCRSPRRAR